MTTAQLRDREINLTTDRLEARDHKLANTPLRDLLRERLEVTTNLDDAQKQRVIDDLVPWLELRTRVLERYAERSA